MLPRNPEDLLYDQKNMMTWQQSAESLAKDMNFETITGTVSWYNFSSLSGICVKPILHRRRRRIYESLQKPSQKTKVTHTYIFLDFDKHCEELSWIHRKTTLLSIRRIAERAARRAKEATSVAKEVLITPKEGEFAFLVADGSTKLFVRNNKFQEPTLTP